MNASRASVVKRARNIRLLAMDVDGVLTSGEIVILKSGEEIKFWNSKDRLAMALVRDKGHPIQFAWITGRRSPAVRRAAKDLGVRFLAQRSHKKLASLKRFAREMKISLRQTAFIGDDLIDIPAMAQAGLAACPKDAAVDVKKVSHYVSPFDGGRGVVRDILEMILRAQNKWKPLTKNFLSSHSS